MPEEQVMEQELLGLVDPASGMLLGSPAADPRSACIAAVLDPSVAHKTDDYQAAANRTESPIEEAIDRLQSKMAVGAMQRKMRMIHALLGMVTEIGELADVMKRHLFYGSDLDQVHMAEEVGDLEWYSALMAAALGQRLSTIQKANIAKLAKRYPGKYTDMDAIDRELHHEVSELKRFITAEEQGEPEA